jgi:hypothetical protein
VRLAVVVSTWSGNPPEYLLALCRSMQEHEAGVPFDPVLVANGLDFQLPSELRARFREVLVRENRGLNLGAWDHAWRALPEHERFLFLQDDCRVLRKGWLADFARRFESVPRCGLVGEHLNHGWDRPWGELCDAELQGARKGEAGRRFAARARGYRERLAAWGVPEGATARHLTSVVHFTSREMLEAVNGYRSARDHDEAIAAEIAFSRQIAARDRELVQVAARRHSRIGHREWKSESLLSHVRALLRERRP